MKYVFVIFTVLFCSFGAFALDARQIQNQLQQLENEISQLEAKYNKKSAELQACEKSSQNFKIAGIATLAGTGAGVMGNIALRKKYAEKTNKKSGGTLTQYSNQEQVNSAACEQFAATKITPENKEKRCKAIKDAGCTRAECN